jgi:2-polyprenyl-3-methyl-5-hydroxy-6-metoxy-1,4-benzoquinol methylase
MESIYEAHVDPESPNHAHGIALQLVGSGKRVLELGAAGGHVTRALKARDNFVTAVEMDAQFEETLGAAADEVFMTNLDWLDLTKKLFGKKFDVILAGDVLEHCVHPDLVVSQFHQLLEREGRLVVSLPNVAHGDVRLSLLAGVFKYSETGLLDRTHLRLFTRETIKTFFESSGFVIEKIFGSTTPLGTTEIGVPDAGIPVAAIEYVRNQRDSSVYQYILELRPDPHWHELNVGPVESISEDATMQQLLAENGLLRSTVAHLRDYSSELLKIENNEEALAQLNNQLAVQSDQLAVQSDQLAVQSDQLAVQSDQLAVQSDQLAVQSDHIVELQKLIAVQSDDIGELQKLIVVAQRNLLQARDQIIGNTARQAELDHHMGIARNDNEILRQEINAIYRSRTWKLGRIVMLPLRIVRRLIAKLK